MDINPLLRRHAEQTTEQAVLLFDRTATIVWCNATAANIFGYAREALVGRTCHVLFTPEDVRNGIPDYEFEVARLSADMTNDRWLVRADGSQFWAVGSTTALCDERNMLVGFCKMLRDKTDLKEQIEMLQNRVDSLVKSDEHKNIFLSTLSHELRNPLAPLANALQLIRMTSPEDPALQYPIKLIERQVEFISRLVDDLLDVTRISAGKIELQLQATEIKDVIARAVESTRPLMAQRGHRLDLHLLQAPIVIKADPDRLEQVFVNLLTNAAKYTPERGHIEVRATLDQSYALVHVSDNGIGIPKEMQPHIFELFTQVSGSPESAEGGLGIGLSIVKNLVELHNGSVQVRSEGAGKGSEFTIYLPLAEAPP